MIFGNGNHRYEFQEGWGRLPDGEEWGETIAVACDSQDRVYVFARGKRPLTVFEQDGAYIGEWGAGLFESPHGIYIDPDDCVYCADMGVHALFKFDPNGRLIQTLGTPGTPNDGKPFHMVTDCAMNAEGDLFVSDGYGNRRVHRFSPSGELLYSWGEDGDGPGQFKLVHNVRIDREGNVWVCDRPNRRIQIFDQDGNYLREIGGLAQPDTVFFDPVEDVFYLAELEFQVSVRSLDGDVIAQWGGEKTDRPGEFSGWPHGIWVDSQGSLYVTQARTQNKVQKYIRLKP